MPLFDLLTLFADPTPRGGPEQMALDEALLETCARPILRIYLWNGPAVSFGYSQSLAEVAGAYPGIPLVRRWTGGGIVEHGNDWTFSLIVPAGEPFVSVRPAESYRQIHAVIAAALAGNTLLDPGIASGPMRPGACFVQPVRDDVLSAEGRKVCGGAQRRTRKGVLHQGSVQHCAWPPDMAGRVSAGLAARTESVDLNACAPERVKELVEEKYGSFAWRERHP